MRGQRDFAPSPRPPAPSTPPAPLPESRYGVRSAHNMPPQSETKMVPQMEPRKGLPTQGLARSTWLVDPSLRTYRRACRKNGKRTHTRAQRHTHTTQPQPRTPEHIQMHAHMRATISQTRRLRALGRPFSTPLPQGSRATAAADALPWVAPADCAGAEAGGAKL